MELNKTYKYSEIEEYAEKNDFDFNEHGQDVIGTGFIVINDKTKDFVQSFVLTGTQGDQYAYKCIYSD